MAGDSFAFKEFEVNKPTVPWLAQVTDAVLLGAWGNLPESGNTLDIGTGTE